MTVDFEQLAKDGMPAEKLANVFLKEYFSDREMEFPINPFQMLRDMGVMFTFRSFKKYEAIYIPAVDEDDFPIVGININRPIPRQRFSASHELCHHLKDANSEFMCTANPRSAVEKYAENFAAELLMPSKVLRKKVEEYEKNGYVEFDDVLKIADFFGISFKACLTRIAYRLHKIKGDTSNDSLNRRLRKFKPTFKRKELGLSETVLYEQLFDALGDYIDIKPTKSSCQNFKASYIYYDSRMEGVDIDIETASAIVVDLRLNKQASIYCNETNKNIIEVAGLTLAYDYAFENAESELSVYDAKNINEKLYSTAVFPEYGGKYRESNAIVTGSNLETIDYRKIQEEMFFYGKEISNFLRNSEGMSTSEYIENVVRLHHRLTVIHAFIDGNGRTSRAFANMMLLKRHIPPVFFKEKEKADYKEALSVADTKYDYTLLYEQFYKSILNSLVELTDTYID